MIYILFTYYLHIIYILLFTYIFTGGASGLGEATVKHLISLGANVAIFDMSDEKGKIIESENQKNVIYVHVDVCDEKQVQQGIDELIKKFGSTLYGVVNAAGIGVCYYLQ